jgi:formate hydrogenlyase subunit 3/multisubunit Na+/H+ antiporter MnhD subunit
MGSDQLGEVLSQGKKPFLFFVLFLLGGYTIIGLPPSGTFMGKWLLVNEAFKHSLFIHAFVILLGSVLAGAYIFKVYRLNFTTNESIDMYKKGMTGKLFPVFLLAVLAIFTGLLSQPITDFMVGGK